MLLLNGNILTMDRGVPAATALAIRRDVIVYVGSDKEALRHRSANTVVYDLGARTVTPGLIDTHIHAIRGGQSYDTESHWHDKPSLHDALAQLRAEARDRASGQWIAVVGGWHPHQFAERREPTRQELDEIASDRPIYVQYLYDHALLNTRAIRDLRLNEGMVPPGIEVERDADGHATGKLRGGIVALSALHARISARPEAEKARSLRLFFGELNKSGVTSIVDPAAGDYSAFSPLFSLWRANELTVRVGYRVSVLARSDEAQWFRSALAYLPPGFGDSWLRFVGIGENLVVEMNDGVRQAPGFSPSKGAHEELKKVATLAAERGYSVEIHAYTDDAANRILDVFEEVNRPHALKDLRWSIAHMNTGKPATFERMNRLGVGLTVQMGPYYEAAQIRESNGPASLDGASPARMAISAGVPVAGGTDATRVGDFHVWRAIEFQVAGIPVGEAQAGRRCDCLSRMEALSLYTRRAAWFMNEERGRGTLSVGKLADIAVLDQPFLTMPEQDIHKIRSVMTIVGGRVVHETGAVARR